MAQETKIIFQYYIPNRLISEFEGQYLDNKIGSAIHIEIAEKSKWSNFDGEELTDIVIYIQQHTTELITGGLLVNVAYDLLKGGVKLLWSGLSKLSIKKLQNKGKEGETPKSITIKFEDRDRIVEIAFEGDVKEEYIDKIINQAIGFINCDSLKKSFENPDFIPSREDKPRIRLKYNIEKQIWEPVNFGDYRRQREQMVRWRNVICQAKKQTAIKNEKIIITINWIFFIRLISR